MVYVDSFPSDSPCRTDVASSPGLWEELSQGRTWENPIVWTDLGLYMVAASDPLHQRWGFWEGKVQNFIGELIPPISLAWLKASPLSQVLI